jgi:cytidylate kinase
MSATKVNLKQYMKERDGLNVPVKKPGPYITISREFGCKGDRLAKKLLKRIEERTDDTWKYLSKHIIEESAEELRLTSDRVEDRVVKHGTNPVTNIFSGVGSTTGISNKKIIERVKEIIRNYAKKGNVVIVGRGGAALTQKIPNGLHVRLIAPVRWRIEAIMRWKDISRLKATEMVNEMDVRRRMWTENLSDKPFDNNYYDLVINNQKMKEKDILDIIMHILEKRKMIPRLVTA